MANKHNSFNELFTSIANAIRSKTGSTNSIVADDFPTAISEISTGFPNATKWTQSTINSKVNSIYNANGTWVSGTNNGLYYSQDGITWTQSNINFGNFEYIINANGIWAASGSANTLGIYYSTDGINWIQSNITFDSSVYLIGIYYANGIWISNLSNKYIYYSTDGKNWTQSDISPVSFLYVYNANGIWVASGYQGIYYSTDGINWTQSNITSSSRQAHYANGIWVASVHGDSIGLYYSTDGKIWTLGFSIDTDYISFCYYANGMWLANTYNNHYVYYSSDGKNWTKINNCYFQINCFHYSNGFYNIGRASGGGISYSTDFITWTQSNINNEYIYYINNINGIWVSGSSHGLYYSQDGITWTRSNITSGTFKSICYANGIWIALDNNSGNIYYSIGWQPS